MLKKITTFFVISLIIFWIPKYSFAVGWNCKIKNSTPKFLKNYVKDSRKLISNIISKASANPDSSPTVPWILNFNIHPKLFFDEIDFKIENFKSYELPKSIKRDNKFLENELKKMHRFIKSAELSNKSNSIVKDICSWIKNCNIDTKNNDLKAWEAIAEVINNLRKINTLMQYTIENKQSKFNETITMWNLQELKNNFYNYYNNSIQYCSEEKWWTLYNSKKIIWKISQNDKVANVWMKAWNEAILLLKWMTLWKEKKEYETKERELLRKELSRKWISKNMSESIMNNLDDYNWVWQPTTSSNFVTNSFNSIKNTISNKTNTFKEAFNQLMSKVEEKSEKKEEQSIPITAIEDTKTKVESSENSRIAIIEKYKKQLPLTQVQDLQTDKTLNKIIDMHIKIWQTINTLNKLCPIAIKVCKSQWANWNIDCGDCN